MWSVHAERRHARRVRDDQRRDPGRDAAADDDIIGPYYLWRLLIDQPLPGPRLRRRRRSTRSSPTCGRDPAPTSCGRAAGQGEGSPQPFYERYGFVADGQHQSRTRSSCDSTCSRRTSMTTLDPATPAGARIARAPRARADRLADDGQPRRPAAELGHLVPVGGRRDHWSTRTSARRGTATSSRPAARRRSTSTPRTDGDDVRDHRGRGADRSRRARRPRRTRSSWPSTRRMIDEYGWDARATSTPSTRSRSAITPTRWRVA